MVLAILSALPNQKNAVRMSGRSDKSRVRRPDLVLSGSALPDSSRQENAVAQNSGLNSKGWRSLRAMHHNEHYRGVQRPEQ